MKTTLFLLALTFSGATFANCALNYESAELAAYSADTSGEKAEKLLKESNELISMDALPSILCEKIRQTREAAELAANSYKKASDTYADVARECSDTVAVWARENRVKTATLAKNNTDLAESTNHLLIAKCSSK